MLICHPPSPPPKVYRQLLAIWRLPAIRNLVFILFFWKVPWVACEAIAGLKMQERGMPKEHIAYIGALCTIVSVFVPLFLGKITSGGRPLDVCLWFYVPRILMCFVAMAQVWYCPDVKGWME